MKVEQVESVDWDDDEQTSQQWFKWTVEIEVNGTWVRDGFEITEEVLNRMLAEELGFSYDSERKARVIKSPDSRRIKDAQGY